MIFLTNKDNIKYNEIVVLSCCAMMFLGFIEARALLSIGAVLMLIHALLPYNIRHTCQNVQTNGFVLTALAFLGLNVLSWLWSDNKIEANNELVLRLSFLAIPVGMMAVKKFSLHKLKYLVYIINVCLAFVCCRSIYIYFTNIEQHNEAYMLYTTKHGDHIRFSFALVLTFILNLFFLHQKAILSSLSKILLGLSTILFAIFLHILSARTGLLCFYAACTVIVLYFSWKRSKLLALGSIVSIVLLVLGTIAIFPRFKNKVAYIKYEISQWNNPDESVQYTLSDNNRMLSYDIAWKSIQAQPLLGVGIGDVKDEMTRLYQTYYPRVPEEGILKLPHNQLLSSAMSLGVLGPMLLILFIVLPLKQAKNHKIFALSSYLVIFLAYLIDAYLEVQLGSYLFLFFGTLWTMIAQTDS